jgi:hypothetical protein
VLSSRKSVDAKTKGDNNINERLLDNKWIVGRRKTNMP